MSRALITSRALAREEVLRCPGCEAWQLHYTLSEMSDLIDWKDAHPSRGTLMDVDLSHVDHCIETILREHVVYDCPGARRVWELWEQRSA